jgi:hypothetical protein
VTKLSSFLLSGDAISLIAAELVVVFSWVFDLIARRSLIVDPQYEDERETILLYCSDVAWRTSLLTSVPLSILGVLLLCFRIQARPGFIGWIFLVLIMFLLGSIYIVVVKGSPFELQKDLLAVHFLPPINYYSIGNLGLTALNIASFVLAFLAFVPESGTPPPKPLICRRHVVIEAPHCSGCNLPTYSVSSLGSIGPFNPSKFDVLSGAPKKTDLCNYGSLAAVVQAIRNRTEKRLVSVLLVGSSDRLRLGEPATRVFGSNEGLARARAEWTKTQLIACRSFRKDSLPELIVLTRGPAIRGDDANEHDTDEDRFVMVEGLWVQYGSADDSNSRSSPQ